MIEPIVEDSSRPVGELIEDFDVIADQLIPYSQLPPRLAAYSEVYRYWRDIGAHSSKALPHNQASASAPWPRSPIPHAAPFVAQQQATQTPPSGCRQATRPARHRDPHHPHYPSVSTGPHAHRPGGSDPRLRQSQRVARDPPRRTQTRRPAYPPRTRGPAPSRRADRPATRPLPTGPGGRR